MDRQGIFASPQLGSYSLYNMFESSEPISEAEEINEVRSLHDKGVRAAKTNKLQEAISIYNEALEIDSRDPAVLQARALVYLQMGNTKAALEDAENIISISPVSSQAYLIKGLAYQQTKQFRESFDALMTALDLDPKNADKLTSHIATLTARLCNLPSQQLQSLKAMDAYNKLSEIGAVLYYAAHYQMCVQVLEVAQRFQTNQKGITMRVLLTLANAKSRLGSRAQALSLYQECLALATATHEQVYQTKALVHIASLQLESGDTYQAIISYQKLVCLEAELKGEAGNEMAMPDFWTKELQCGLHLNLSIAYKSIGDMMSAVKHATQYSLLVEKFGLDVQNQAESYHNTGMLNEILGDLPAALTCYEKYLNISKQNSDHRGMAKAYGCLGSAHASLGNWPTSVEYHQQHISMATQRGDARMAAMAQEMLGDTYMLKEDFDSATTQYETVVNMCPASDDRAKAMALCKLGKACCSQGRGQYGLHFLQEALILAHDNNFADIRVMAEYHQALIQSQSMQLSEMEHAQKLLSRLIPFFEKKIAEHTEENSYCPQEYHCQLSHCYDGMVAVLAKSGDKEGSLQFAEQHRKRSVTLLPNYQVSGRTAAHLHDAQHDLWTFDRIHRVVTQQKATVVYYSLLDHVLLTWVLQPGSGLVRFYTGRSSKETSIRPQIVSLLNALLKDRDKKDDLTHCENRAIPLRSAPLEHLKKQNQLRLQMATSTEQLVNTESCAEKGIEVKSSFKTSPQRQLYEILISPVEEVLLKMEEPRHVIIIPDKELHRCPFAALQDWRGTLLGKQCSISYVPCLLALDHVIQNEMAALRHKDDLNFDRKQCCKGGLGKFPSQTTGPVGAETSQHCLSCLAGAADINLRQVSNPRLATSGLTQKSRNATDGQVSFGHDQTSKPRSVVTKPVTLTPALTHQCHCGHETSKMLALRKQQAVGAAPLPAQALSGHTFTTLTTSTWTGTDITTSTQVVPFFQQMSDTARCVVFGLPTLPDRVMLHGRPWKVDGDLKSARRELKMVGEMLDTDPVIGSDATKRRFLHEIREASVLHIATYACLEEGMLLVTPDSRQSDSEADDSSHLVTVDDIVSSRMVASLVVLSAGFSPVRQNCLANGYRLPAAFLAAGAQCVLTTLWQVPDVAMEKFLFAFFTSLKVQDRLAQAFSVAIESLKKDDRLQAVWIWGAFVLIGHDCQVQLDQLQHSQLDQRIDRAEREVEEESGREILNLRSSMPPVASKEENYEKLQEFLAELLCHHHRQPHVIPILIDLLDTALKRLHTEENNKVTAQLPADISGSLSAIRLLKQLGFHFQAKGKKLVAPYIVFPHHNTDDLLIPAYDALRALVDLSSDVSCCKALVQCLPLSQDNLSLMVDLLSITKHAAEVQLKVSDVSVKPLWQSSLIRKLLKAVGLHQVGLLLTFNCMPLNNQLLTSMLQLLLAVSCYKSPVLLYRLDVSLLGRESDDKTSVMSESLAKLPSLTPLILPRNQLRMSTPWLSCLEQSDEMMEKIKLAKSKSDLAETYHRQLQRAKSWHQTSVVAQANEALSDFGMASSMPSKVKVMSGSTASQQRLPVHREPVLILQDIDTRRDYANHVLRERLKGLEGRHGDDVFKLFLPYIKA